MLQLRAIAIKHMSLARVNIVYPFFGLYQPQSNSARQTAHYDAITARISLKLDLVEAFAFRFFAAVGMITMKPGLIRLFEMDLLRLFAGEL